MIQRACWCILILFLLAVGVSAQSQDENAYIESPSDSVNTESQIDERLLPIGDSEDADQSVVAARAIGAGDIVRMLLVLIVVIGIIYATFILLKRASRAQVQSSSVIHNISTMSLGGNKALHIIKIGTHYYVIGSTEQSVQLIETIEDEESIDTINLYSDGSPRAHKGTFKARIAALLNSVHKPAGASKSASQFISQISRNRQRLKNI